MPAPKFAAQSCTVTSGCTTLHRCTAQLHFTLDIEPAAASSVEGVAVADSATAHDKGGVTTENNDAAATTTFRIAVTVRDQHVDQREGAVSSYVCAPALSRRAASRDAAPDHRERAAIKEEEAACLSICPRVHGVAAPDVAIDEPALCTSHKQDAAAYIASAAVDDQRLRHPHSRSEEVPVSRTVSSLGGGARRTACTPATPRHSTGPKLVGEAVCRGISGARRSRLCATRAEVQTASHKIGVGLANDAAIQQRHVAIGRKHRAAKELSVAALDTADAL
eukprot:scaffold664_cov79-Phaeocystis_antarctica.AAC.2